MENYYFTLMITVNVLFIIYVSFILIKLIIDFIKAYKNYKQSKVDLTKKYDSGYADMFKYLNNAMSGKNKETYSTEEENLEQLKMLINKRINAIKGN